MLDNEDYDHTGLVKQSFTSIANNNEDEELSLLEEFGDNESVEDPFAFGTESIMKDIMEDEIYQRQSTYEEEKKIESRAKKPHNTSHNQSLSIISLDGQISLMDALERSLKNINHSFNSIIFFKDQNGDSLDELKSQ